VAAALFGDSEKATRRISGLKRLTAAFTQDKDTMNLDGAVVVRTYAGEMVASIAAARLGSEGIEAHIQKDDCGGAYPALQMSGGVRLLVNPEDVGNAQKILNELEAEDSGASQRVEEQGQPEDRRGNKSSPILMIGLFLLGLAAGYFLSPELTNRGTYTGDMKTDKNEQGKPGVFLHYVEGQLARSEEDRNYDGKVDAWHKYAAGKIRTSEYDDKFSGQANRWMTYKDRFNVEEKVDTDFDGKPDVTTSYVNGVQRRRDWHPKDSPIIEQRELYEHGVLKEKLVDTDGDGIFDQRITYDPYERPVGQSKCWIPQ
jgi:hypothetical protein